MNENLDIFICAHKDFNRYPKNPVYSIIASEGQLNEQYELNTLYEKDGKYTYMQEYINEFTRMYWISKNVKLKDYVGFCHYRRYFKFFNNIPDMNETFKTYDLITPKQLKVNVRDNYNIYHNLYDYTMIQQIIMANYYDITANDLAEFDKSLYACNMFVMRTDDFQRYVEFVSNIIDEFIRVMKFNSGKDIENYIIRNNNLYRHEDMTYQRRMIGFLSERISSIYFKKYHKNILEYDLIQIL